MNGFALILLGFISFGVTYTHVRMFLLSPLVKFITLQSVAPFCTVEMVCRSRT